MHSMLRYIFKKSYMQRSYTEVEMSTDKQEPHETPYLSLIILSSVQIL